MISSVVNDTHDPSLKSWVESANQPGADFPIQNLPFGICRKRADSERPKVFVAIGDSALDISACASEGLLAGAKRAAEACASGSLNRLMALGTEHAAALRHELQTILRVEAAASVRNTAQTYLTPIADMELFVPAEIGDYSDFYANLFHARNVGSMFRPSDPLPANYRYVPIGYHGRASSIVASGMPVRRPQGQTRPNPSESVLFGPTRQLDYEMEVGMFVGRGNEIGEPIPIREAESHIFGLCLVNDWSARDLQIWESQPLGPFLAKSFATTVSPWVVTLEALAPFRVPAFAREPDDPQPLPYLLAEEDRRQGGIDLMVEVFLSSEQMRRQACEPTLLSRGNFRDMYWTWAQMLTHQTSNGCNLRIGDLLASGTVSGPAKENRGCLLELTWRGSEPIHLPSGETRQFLEDGDEVIFRGHCQRPGAVRIGFGECRGRIEPASLH